MRTLLSYCYSKKKNAYKVQKSDIQMGENTYKRSSDGICMMNLNKIGSCTMNKVPLYFLFSIGTVTVCFF